MTEKLVLENDNTFIYYVDVEKGTVVAVMDKPYNELKKTYEKMREYFYNNDIIFLGEECLFKPFNTPIRGKAVCAEQDEFDLKTGMKIAREKCLAKYYKRYTRFFISLNDIFDPILSFIEDKAIMGASRYKHFHFPDLPQEYR